MTDVVSHLPDRLCNFGGVRNLWCMAGMVCEARCQHSLATRGEVRMMRVLAVPTALALAPLARLLLLPVVVFGLAALGAALMAFQLGSVMAGREC